MVIYYSVVHCDAAKKPQPQYTRRAAEGSYPTQLGIVEVHCGGGDLTRAETNFHCSNADGWTKGTLFYPMNFLFRDPPNC